MAVPWLRRLVAGLSLRRPGFDPGSVHVGFVVDKVVLGQVFPRVLRFSPVNFIPPLLHYTEKQKKNTNHLHHRVAQEASKLRCVRSFCCGALKKTGEYSFGEDVAGTGRGRYRTWQVPVVAGTGRGLSQALPLCLQGFSLCNRPVLLVEPINSRCGTHRFHTANTVSHNEIQPCIRHVGS